MHATRSSETRAASGRPSIGGAPRMRLDVDLTGLPSGHEARWVRESVLGQADRANVQDAMLDGFQPATTAMLPNANPPLLPGDSDDSNGLIRRFGMILMTRPKQLGDEEREFHRREVESQKRAAGRLAEANLDGEQPAFDGAAFHEDPENHIRETVQSSARRAGAGRFKDA